MAAPGWIRDNSQVHRGIGPLWPADATWYGCCCCPRVVRLAVVVPTRARGTRQLVHALKFLASPTSLEPGCLGCRVWTEKNDQSMVRYEEVWATEDAIRQRVRSAQFTRFLEVLESAPEPPSVQFDFVTETRGLDYVAEVRNMNRFGGADHKSRRDTGRS